MSDSRTAVVILILVRFCPVGNNFITNLLAGVSGVSNSHFFWASLVGHLPQSILCSLLGKGVSAGKTEHLMAGLFLLVAMTVGFAYYFKRSRLASEVDGELRLGKGHEGSESQG